MKILRLMDRLEAEVLVSAGLAAALTVFAAAAVLAVGNGAQNGQDVNCCGWIGNDNPDGLTGSYAYVNETHNMILSEWNEPSHDWVRNNNIIWTQAAEDKLDRDTCCRTLTYEQRIHDQFYFNYTGNANWNLPLSKVPENENWFEEQQQGYTEVDAEQVDPWRINVNTWYFIDLQFDSEKPSIAGRPDFYSEIEWCDKNFVNCFFDVTGWMERKVLQQ